MVGAPTARGRAGRGSAGSASREDRGAADRIRCIGGNRRNRIRLVPRSSLSGLVPKARRATKRRFARVLANKYYVDEAIRSGRSSIRRIRSRATFSGRRRQRHHRRLLRERERSSCARFRMAWIARADRRGRNVCVGARSWCARCARRRHSPLTMMEAFLESVGYNGWVLPALLIIPIIGAAGDCSRSRRGVESLNEQKQRIAPRASSLSGSSCIEFMVSIGLWWSFDPGIAGLAGGDRCRMDSDVGNPVHARHRRHRADDDSAHDVHHAANACSAAGRA